MGSTDRHKHPDDGVGLIIANTIVAGVVIGALGAGLGGEPNRSLRPQEAATEAKEKPLEDVRASVTKALQIDVKKGFSGPQVVREADAKVLKLKVEDPKKEKK